MEEEKGENPDGLVIESTRKPDRFWGENVCDVAVLGRKKASTHNSVRVNPGFGF